MVNEWSAGKFLTGWHQTSAQSAGPASCSTPLNWYQSAWTMQSHAGVCTTSRAAVQHHVCQSQQKQITREVEHLACRRSCFSWGLELISLVFSDLTSLKQQKFPQTLAWEENSVHSSVKKQELLMPLSHLCFFPQLYQVVNSIIIACAFCKVHTHENALK